MKRLMLCFAACFALFCSAVHAQDITGQWQGTLQQQKDVRIALVIAKDNSALKGAIYSIDQAAQPLKVSSISLDGSTFKFAADLAGIEYEGKLSGDGNTITGTWTQGTKPIQLVLVRATKTDAWEIPAPPPPPKMMPADANPSYEVATIKPNDSEALQSLMTERGRNVTTRATSLDDLIGFAYQVQAKQIVGGPSWMSSERYDIDAVPDVEGAPNMEQQRIMVRKLLADRFQLKFHKETRDMSALVLTVDKGGAKLAHTQFNGPLPGFGMRPAKGGLMLTVINCTIPDFTSWLQSRVLDRPVVDHTGLQGRFDFTLIFLPDETQFNGHSPIGKLADGVEPAPSFSEAMRQQLGLKLSSEKTAVEVIAIDHVEKPSPN